MSCNAIITSLEEIEHLFFIYWYPVEKRQFWIKCVHNTDGKVVPDCTVELGQRRNVR